MHTTAVARDVGAPQEPQQEKQITGTCCPGVYLAKDQNGKSIEVEVVWRLVGKKKKLHVLTDGAKGAGEHLVPVEESGLDFLARIAGIRPPHFECFE